MIPFIKLRKEGINEVREEGMNSKLNTRWKKAKEEISYKKNNKIRIKQNTKSGTSMLHFAP